MALQVLDPTNETAPPLGQPAPRLASLAGKTVGVISNGKEGMQGFFAHLDRMLREEFGVADVISSCSLHDSVTAERLGVPAMAVMTTRFVSAAELMARVLGFPGYAFPPPLNLAIIMRSLLSCISMVNPGMLARPRPPGSPVSGSARTLA
jgi:hypothetical protein